LYLPHVVRIFKHARKCGAFVHKRQIELALRQRSW